MSVDDQSGLSFLRILGHRLQDGATHTEGGRSQLPNLANLLQASPDVSLSNSTSYQSRLVLTDS